MPPVLTGVPSFYGAPNPALLEPSPHNVLLSCVSMSVCVCVRVCVCVCFGVC